MNKSFTLDKSWFAQSYLFGRFVILQIAWPAASLAPWGVGPNAKAKAADLNQFAIVLVTFPSEKLES